MSEQKKSDVVHVGESANKLPGADPQSLGRSPAEQDANKEVNKVFADKPVPGLGEHPTRDAVEKGDPVLPEVKQRLADLKRSEQLTKESEKAKNEDPGLVVNRDDPPSKESLVMGPSTTGDIQLPEDSNESDESDEKKAAKQAGKVEEDTLQKEMERILKEYGGLEGNIPVHHDYWVINNKLRAMRAPKF